MKINMLCFVFAALVVLLDQFIKRWVVRALELGETLDLIPGVIGLVHIQNTGAAFSLFEDQRWILAGISFIASIVLVFILLRYTEGFWGTLGLSAVLGGAVGNLVDRVIHGHVVDMFRFEFIQFAIFNIADIFITLGFLTFCIHFIISTIKTARDDKKDFKTLTAQAGELNEMISFPDEANPPDYDDFSDTKVIPTKKIGSRRPAAQIVREDEPEPPASNGQAPGQELKELPSWQEYYEPAKEPLPDVDTVLDALSALDDLEKELGVNEDYDVGKMLREYGFEEEKD